MRARTLSLGCAVALVLVSLTAAQGSVECPPSVCRAERGSIVGDFITFDHQGVACICPADLQLAAAVDCKQLQKKVARLQTRYAEQCPEPTPVPTKSPSPTETPPALPCETFSQVRAMKPGEPRLICFDIKADYPNPLVEVKHRDVGNVHCALLESELQSPAGPPHQYQIGSQIGGVKPKAVGRWYWYVKLIYGCASHEFYLK